MSPKLPITAWFHIVTFVLRLMLAALLPIFALHLSAQIINQQPPKRILALFPTESSRPDHHQLLLGIERGLEKHSATPVAIHVEFTQDAPPVAEDYSDRLFEWIVYKHRNVAFDAICVLSEEDLTLAKRLKRIWPNVPIVFGLNENHAPGTAGQAVTGIVQDLGTEEAARAALQLLPETQHVAIVAGSAPGDQQIYEKTAALFRKSAAGIEIIPLAGLDLTDLISRVSTLPPRTVIFYTQVTYDSSGRKWTEPGLLAAFSPRSNSPIFSSSTAGFGSGVVGGPMNSLEQGGEYLGKQLARVISGTPAEAMPVMTVPPLRAADWRELKKWDIPEDRLPPGTEIRFRHLSVWAEYGWAIIGASAAILLQAGIIGMLLAERRKRSIADHRARSNEEVNRAILSSLSGRIGIIDQQGTIIRVSDNWDSEGEGELARRFRIGVNYLEAWQDWKHPFEGVPNVTTAIERVLSGERDLETAECRLTQAGEDRWIEIRVERLNRAEGGAVLTHMDVTTQKREIIERRKTLEELHHMNRVVTVGQMAGSLAHELAQPMVAILNNSQAALRFLHSEKPDWIEIREALIDIAAENRRARAIIDRLRVILKKQSVPVQEVDLNRITGEVIRLIQNVSLMRNTAVCLELAPEEVLVRGDPVALQQVLLNLLNNGMDAVQDLSPKDRFLTVRTIRHDENGELLVEDNGPGIPPEIEHRLFDSFFTTKQEGLGMGLSISRAIVESFGGRIGVENRTEGGAIFRVLLPRNISVSAGRSIGAARV